MKTADHLNYNQKQQIEQMKSPKKKKEKNVN